MPRRSRAARLLKASTILARGGPPPNKKASSLHSSDVFLIINFSKDLGELKVAVDRDIEVMQFDMKKIEAGLNDAVKSKMKYAALKEREIRASLLKQALEEDERTEEWVSSNFR